MDKDALWNTFAHSGKVEDYLRYRGIDLPQTTNSVEKEESGNGHRPSTTPDDRRPDSSGV